MVHIAIELFLKNTIEFIDLRTTGARSRGRGGVLLDIKT